MGDNGQYSQGCLVFIVSGAGFRCTSLGSSDCTPAVTHSLCPRLTSWSARRVCHAATEARRRWESMSELLNRPGPEHRRGSKPRRYGLTRGSRDVVAARLTSLIDRPRPVGGRLCLRGVGGGDERRRSRGRCRCSARNVASRSSRSWSGRWRSAARATLAVDIGQGCGRTPRRRRRSDGLDAVGADGRKGPRPR
jgi:hypothetical protein